MEVTALKKVLAISALLVVLVIVSAAMASAYQNNWRFTIKPDDGNTLNSGGAMTIGVFSTTQTKDPYLPGGEYTPTSDASDVRNDYGSLLGAEKCVVGIFPTDSAGLAPATWIKDVKTARMPWEDRYYDSNYAPYYHRKVWDLRVFGLPTADTATPIRLLFTTIGPGTTLLPPASLTYSAGPPVVNVPAFYWLRMVNNRGVAGAPANGTIWSIPIPTAHTSTAYFTLTLPTLRVSVKDESHIISEGYMMEFYQTPEPSSLMALGAGLMALGGFASRRRRK
jgi:hypothetical protein